MRRLRPREVKTRAKVTQPGTGRVRLNAKLGLLSVPHLASFSASHTCGSSRSPQSSHAGACKETRPPGCLVCHHPKEQLNNNSHGLDCKPHPSLATPLPYSFQRTPDIFCQGTTARRLSMPFYKVIKTQCLVAVFMPSFTLTSSTFFQEEMTHFCKLKLDL